MEFGKMTPEGKRKVELALILMARATPTEYKWLEDLGPIIAAQNGGCGCDESTVACTWIQWDNRIKIEFHHDPADMRVPEIAKALRHEARHYADAVEPGYVVQVEHQCSDEGCQNPWQRAVDPIYSMDPWFLQIYGGHWFLHGHRVEADYDERERQQQIARDRARAEAAENLAKGVGIAAGFLLLIAGLAAISK